MFAEIKNPLLTDKIPGPINLPDLIVQAILQHHERIDDTSLNWDRRVDAPSAFNRVSWYVFPLLSLIFLILVYSMIVLPLPR